MWQKNPKFQTELFLTQYKNFLYLYYLYDQYLVQLRIHTYNIAFNKLYKQIIYTYDGNLCVMFSHHAINPNVIIQAAMIVIALKKIPEITSIKAERKLLSVPLYRNTDNLKV